LTNQAWTPRRLVAALAVTGTFAMIGGVFVGYFVLPAPDSDTRTGGNMNARPTPNATVPTVVAAHPGTANPSGTGSEAFPGAPTRINEFGVPVGYPHTEAGAISACGNYVSAYSDIRNREPTRIRQVLGSFSLPEAATGVADFITKADQNIASRLGVPAVNDPNVNFNLRVLGFRVESFNEISSTISVWSVGGTGRYGAPRQEVSPQQRWGTDSCTVRWLKNDWKLSGATDGPTGPLITERPGESIRRFAYIGGPAA
jgi:hypothetical protein